MIHKNELLIIGIDPDIENSGLTIYNRNLKVIEIKSLSFFEIYELLLSAKDKIGTVKIECGFLNAKSNWHNNKSVGIASRIGKNVGQNHQVSKLLIEMCKHLEINYREVKPLPLRWGKSGKEKISHKELELLLTRMEIKCPKRTNADQRDSVLICLF